MKKYSGALLLPLFFWVVLSAEVATSNDEASPAETRVAALGTVQDPGWREVIGSDPSLWDLWELVVPMPRPGLWSGKIMIQRKNHEGKYENAYPPISAVDDGAKERMEAIAIEEGDAIFFLERRC